MAVSVTYAGSPPTLTSTTNAQSFQTSAFSFASGTLYVMAAAHDRSAANATTPTVTSTGSMTWTQVGTAKADYNTTGTPLFTMTAWWAVGLGASEQVTVNWGGANGTGAVLYFVDVTGADNDSPIVQSSANDGDAGTTASATLATFASESNAGLAFSAHDATAGITTDGTELNSGTDLSHANPTHRITAFTWTGTDTAPTSTTGVTSVDWGIIAMEIAEGGAGATGSPEVVARSFTTPAVTLSAAVSLEPTTISRSFTAPQTDPQAGVSLTPTTITRSFTTPQAAPRTEVSLTPTTVARSFAVSQVTATGGTGLDIGQTLETDEAMPLRTPVRVGQVTETDEAIRFSAMAFVSFASETDTAQPIDLFTGEPGTGIVRSPNRVRIYASHNEVT